MPTTKWATEADWVEHRSTITGLYRQKPLLEVIKHMKRVHNFHATARMYKARLKTWRVAKYVKYAKDNALVGNHHSMAYYTSLVPPENSAGSMVPQISVPTITPCLGAPASQQKVLDCLRILERYVVGNAARGQWRPSYEFMKSLEKSDWLAQITTVTILLKGGELQAGFHLLSGCFDAFKTNLQAESPLLTSEAFMAAFQLMSVSPSLGWSFLKYICQLSGIVLQTSHPLFQLLSKYLTLDSAAFANGSDLFLGCFLNLMALHVSGWHESHRAALLLTTGRMFLLSMTTLPQYNRLRVMSENGGAMPLLGHQHVLHIPTGELPPAATRPDTLSLYPDNPARITVMKQDAGGQEYLSFETL
ncbi:hypothetical protein N7492_008740 [Penicillium capsulatum]|uniref:Clr5 domain-containing protein n=1 Tax=Penicillium capsulatum TaxID=69766 RepID=A0A9W9LHE2_9EURO|nr:hypothetical protein N7492_008740 [Penicillium capsulatum]KAJ6106144.1 hypothetical protein N7512_009661 [Penicillium capsulatum]